MTKKDIIIVSVAMTTYNGEKYLREQLDSIYSQTMVPDEVVVVDDCSTDGTITILEEYKQKYGLKYYQNQFNIGYNKNFERAIGLCKGEYIALSDQDDIWLPEKIEHTYKKLKEYPENEPSLVSSFSTLVNERMEVLSEGKFTSGGWQLNFSRYSSQGCTLMFNRALKDIILPIHQDIMFDAYIGFTASLIGNRYYLGESLMLYRIHSNNAFVKKDTLSLMQRIKRKLHFYLPCWFSKTRYRFLLTMKANLRDRIKPNRLSYLDKIISLYEIRPIKRCIVFATISEVPLINRIKTCSLLLIKSLFGIKDIY